MPTDDDLLAKVEQFLADNDVAPTRFGREAMGEASLVSRMRSGRSMSLRNANKLIAFMNAYRAAAEVEGVSEKDLRGVHAALDTVQ